MSVDSILGAAPPPDRAGGRYPTPLEQWTEAGDSFGVELLTKREDLLDDLWTGHKGRKLAYVLACAPDGVDHLVTGGSLPSSQCVAVGRQARRRGMACTLVYTGDQQERPAEATGSYLLALLTGAEIVWHERTPWDRIGELMEAAAGQARAAGARPFVLPPGLGAWPGVLGSVDLGLELAAQLAERGRWDGELRTHVVVAAGSGTTAAGLSVASELAGAHWQVHGMCIGAGRKAVEASVRRTLSEVAKRTGERWAGSCAVAIHGETVGEGYDRPSEADLRRVEWSVAELGVPLDPTYVGKAFGGVAALRARGVIQVGDRVVFVHTGGSLGVVGPSGALQEWIRGRHPEALRVTSQADRRRRPSSATG